MGADLQGVLGVGQQGAEVLRQRAQRLRLPLLQPRQPALQRLRSDPSAFPHCSATHSSLLRDALSLEDLPPQMAGQPVLRLVGCSACPMRPFTQE